MAETRNIKKEESSLFCFRKEVIKLYSLPVCYIYLHTHSQAVPTLTHVNLGKAL